MPGNPRHRTVLVAEAQLIGLLAPCVVAAWLAFGPWPGLAVAAVGVAFIFLGTRLIALRVVRLTQARYRSIFEDSRDAILITRPSGEIVDVNHATLHLLGYEREEMLEMNARDMYANPRKRLRFTEEMTKSGSVLDYEEAFQTKSGEVIECLFTSTAQRDKHGEIVAYQSILRDISRQKQAEKLLEEYNQNLERRVEERTQKLQQAMRELETAQDQLVEAEKLSALGTLVAGVAHEINTPIGVGVTAASLLEEKTKKIKARYESGKLKRSDFAKYIDAASQSSRILLSNLERAASLIRSFKQVAVDQSSEQRRAFALRGYLQEVLLSLHPKLKQTRHTIDIRGDDDIIINGYPGAFSQIITNLVMNSLIHAFGPDEAGNIVFDMREIEDEDGRRVVLEYSDDGAGIPEEHMSKLFEPFFSTKRGQGGSGLGLHIVYNLVHQRLRGTIRCESAVGEGTKFIIEMPLSAASGKFSLSRSSDK